MIKGLAKKYIVTQSTGNSVYTNMRDKKKYNSINITINVYAKGANGKSTGEPASIDFFIIPSLKRLFILNVSNDSGIVGLGADLIYSAACLAYEQEFTIELVSVPDLGNRNKPPERLHAFYEKLGMNRNDTIPVTSRTSRGYKGNTRKILKTPYFEERVALYNDFVPIHEEVVEVGAGADRALLQTPAPMNRNNRNNKKNE
jgi:hypothetical protein